MKVVIQHNIHYRRPQLGSLTQQHAYRLGKAHFQHFDSSELEKNCYGKVQ